MKITATILLSLFSILSGYAQTSYSVPGLFHVAQISQKHENTAYGTSQFSRDSIGLLNSSALQSVKVHEGKNKISTDNKYTWHHYLAVLFREVNSKGSGDLTDHPRASDKMDYYRGKSLLFK